MNFLIGKISAKAKTHFLGKFAPMESNLLYSNNILKVPKHNSYVPLSVKKSAVDTFSTSTTAG